MTVFSHVLATYFLGKVFKVKDLKIWVLLWIFGVLIDLDSAIFRPLQFWNPKEWYYHHESPRYLRTFIQEPISLLWLVPLSLFVFKTPIPVFAFLLHLLMDYIEIKIKKPFWPFSSFSTKWGLFHSGTKLEFILSTTLLLIVLVKEREVIEKFFYRALKRAIPK